MSDTPRSDAPLRGNIKRAFEQMRERARQLERELNEALRDRQSNAEAFDRAADDRDRWKAMAEELARFFYQTKTGNQEAHEVYQRFTLMKTQTQ